MNSLQTNVTKSSNLATATSSSPHTSSLAYLSLIEIIRGGSFQQGVACELPEGVLVLAIRFHRSSSSCEDYASTVRRRNMLRELTRKHLSTCVSFTVCIDVQGVLLLQYCKPDE